ncbi:MAG: hypothetical protein WCT05_12075 [Lentisphaeria bacterium]
MSTLSEHYLNLLKKWFASAEADLSPLPGSENQLVYGTGFESWGVQTQQKAFAAYAIAGCLMKPEDHIAGKTRDEMLTTAIQMLRFSLDSHIEGNSTCTDGNKWGHTWISVLGIERMMTGVDLITPKLPEDLRKLLQKVLVSEADWLLHEYSIVASPDDPGKNKPESNLWNGAFLHRIAILYPDCPNAAEYREKGTAFLFNSISVASDLQNQNIIQGKRIADWHIGGNFQETYALVHHGYMNIGYMVICLSQIAMLHFTCRERGIAAPESLYHHALDLWKLVKKFTYPDGRLLRIGGDTRVRYCYCQDYAISVWLLMADHFADPDCLEFEKHWLETVQKEQDLNEDGSFLGVRLARLKENSPLYYTRLESDRAVTLAQAAFWHAKFENLEKVPAAPQPQNVDFSWHDPFHGALFLRTAENARSWVWMAAKAPFGLCLPWNDSSLAEWDFNASGQILGTGANTIVKLCSHQERMLTNGFITIGKYAMISTTHIGEGQKDDVIAETQIACAALPDRKSMLFMQYSKAPKRVYITSLKGLMLQVPNDLYNNFSRRFISPEETWEFNGLRPPFGPQKLNTKILNIDEKITVELCYGADSLTVNRLPARQIEIRYKAIGGGNLYTEEICSKCFPGLQKYEVGELLLDECFALQTAPPPASLHFLSVSSLSCAPECRFAAFQACDGKTYAMAANFGKEEGTIEFKDKITLCEVETSWSGSQLRLSAGSCHLYMLADRSACENAVQPALLTL